VEAESDRIRSQLQQQVGISLSSTDQAKASALSATHMPLHPFFRKKKHASSGVERTWWAPSRISQPSPPPTEILSPNSGDCVSNTVAQTSVDNVTVVTEVSRDNEWLTTLYGCTSGVDRVRLLALRISGSPKEQAVVLTLWILGPEGGQQYIGRSLLHCMVEDAKNKFEQYPPSEAATVFEEQSEAMARSQLGLRGSLLKPSWNSRSKIEAFQATIPGDPDCQTETLLGTDDKQVMSDGQVRQLHGIVEFLLREFTHGVDMPKLRSVRGRRLFKMGEKDWVAA
jgi:hypothetical protein